MNNSPLRAQRAPDLFANLNVSSEQTELFGERRQKLPAQYRDFVMPVSSSHQWEALKERAVLEHETLKSSIPEHAEPHRVKLQQLIERQLFKSLFDLNEQQLKYVAENPDYAALIGRVHMWRVEVQGVPAWMVSSTLTSCLGTGDVFGQVLRALRPEGPYGQTISMLAEQLKALNNATGTEQLMEVLARGVSHAISAEIQVTHEQRVTLMLLQLSGKSDEESLKLTAELTGAPMTVRKTEEGSDWKTYAPNAGMKE